MPAARAERKTPMAAWKSPALHNRSPSRASSKQAAVPRAPLLVLTVGNSEAASGRFEPLPREFKSSRIAKVHLLPACGRPLKTWMRIV